MRRPARQRTTINARARAPWSVSSQQRITAMISSVRGGSAGKWRPLFDDRRRAWPPAGERCAAGESSGGGVGMTPPSDERDEAALAYHRRPSRTRRVRKRRIELFRLYLDAAASRLREPAKSAKPTLMAGVSRMLD